MALDMTQVKMIEERAAFILPEDLEHDTAMEIIEALNYAQHLEIEEFLIYCLGAGGDLPASLAISDMLEMTTDIKIKGLLLGQANSAHADVFLSCHERYHGRSARLGIHKPKYSIDSGVDDKYAKNIVESLRDYTKRSRDLLMRASNMPSEHWEHIYEQTGAYGVYNLDPVELEMFEISRPASMLEHSLKYREVGAKHVN